MTRVLTSAGFGVKRKNFNDQVKKFLDFKEVYSLGADEIAIVPKKIQDLFDMRKTERITKDLVLELTHHLNEDNKIVIISHSMGSYTVELALTHMISEMGNFLKKCDVKHVMFAPALNGSKYANMAKIAFTGLGILTIFLPIPGKIKGLKIPFWWLLGNKDRVLNELGDNDTSFITDYFKINRYISYSNDEKLLRHVTYDIPNSEYYVSNYSHHQLGQFNEFSKQQVYVELYPKKGRYVSKQDLIHRLVK